MLNASRIAYLPAGKDLTSWITTGGCPEVGFGTRGIYRWKSYWFEKNWRLQRKLIPTSNFDGDGGARLLFVLGFWRSGTTLLHELLAVGPSMATPQTWQCMNPSSFRLVPPPARSLSARRPMDAVLVSARSPQEDEFALLSRGVPSVYRTWIDPRRWQETLPALCQETWLNLDDHEWFSDWREFLGWCMPSDAQALVVKSPNHVFRLKAIQRKWPRARYVWTLRDPADTWFSNRKMWQAMMGMYALWEWRLEDIDHLLFTAFNQYVATLRWALEVCNPEQMVVVGFGDLTKNTSEVLRELTMRLNLGPWDEWNYLARTRLEESAIHPVEMYPTEPSLPEYGRAVIEEIRELHQCLLSRPHYFR